MESTILETLLSADNTSRKNAEAALMQARETDPVNLLTTLVEGMKNSAKPEVAQLACLMYKKLFLDDSRAQNLSTTDLEMMKTSIMQTIDLNQPLTLLKRKGDILSKVYAKLNQNEDLLKLLVDWAQSDLTQSRQFSMYVFEVLADCHLTPEQLTSYKDSFMTIFSKSLTDRELTVRVAALKATTSFLTSLDDSDMVMGYQGIIPQILNTVVDALKENEEQGKLALDSMNDLTNIHPEIWKNTTNQLGNVISQVMTQTNFENGTRASAIEVVLALGASVPASLRKIDETKTMFLTGLARMLTEVETDFDTWSTTEDDANSTDPYNTAINAINRLALDLGEKTVLPVATALIQEMVKSADWKQRQAAYMLMGLISESCKDSMKKNMAEAMKMGCMGIVDENPRVRYAGLSCVALLLTELAPTA